MCIYNLSDALAVVSSEMFEECFKHNRKAVVHHVPSFESEIVPEVKHVCLRLHIHILHKCDV